MSTITAFIPVYGRPKKVSHLARKLSDEAFPDSSVVVVVDGETNPEIDAALAEIRDLPRVRVIEGNPHEGKAIALNRAVAGTRSDYLVFLDNDISIPDGVALLGNCLALLQKKDIVELPKQGRGKGPVAAMVKLEFLANIIGSKVVVDTTGQCPSMNGAAFAVRRKLFDALGGFSSVINEDVDFGARAYLAGASFGIDPSVRVLDDVPETVKAWYNQRKRWSISLGLWGNTYVGKILTRSAKNFWGMFACSATFPAPFITALIAVLALARLPLEAGKGMAGILPSALGLGVYLLCGAFYARNARYFDQPFSWPAFGVYSLIYLPVWGIASAAGTVLVAFNAIPSIDWKCVTKPGRRSVPRAKFLRRQLRVERSRNK